MKDIRLRYSLDHQRSTSGTRWVAAVETLANPTLRLTLTLPALTRATNIYVLVAGSNKAHALHHVLTGVPDPSSYPAAGIRFTKGRLIWWVDRAAEHWHGRLLVPS